MTIDEMIINNQMIDEEMLEEGDFSVEEAVAESAVDEDTAKTEENAPATDQTEETPSEQAPYTEEDIRLVEAVLFASAEPLTRRMIANYLRGRDVDGLIAEIEKRYTNRGVNLLRSGDAWAFRTAPDLAAHLGNLTQVPRKLSRAVTETLAIIAYHQPVTRAEIEQIRGVVTHKGALDTLMELEWIKPGRRRETLGRPVTWVTTQAFLDHFSLSSSSDLPGIDDLRASGLLDSRPTAATLFDRLEEEGQDSENEDSIAEELS